MKRLVCIILACVLLLASGCAAAADTDPTESTGKAFDKQEITLEINNQQDLDEIYQIEPFNELLPRKIPEGFQVVGGWGHLRAGDFSIYDSSLSLTVNLENADGISLNVFVNEFRWDTYPQTVLANPNKPETYDFKWYEEWSKTEHESRYLEGFSGTFYAKYITPEHIKARTRNNEISIEAACGKYVVSYWCSDYEAKDGAELVSAEELYEMIVSAPCVKALKP